MVSGRNLSSKKVCVVGAGPAGLVAAREMVKEGHDVVVIEQSHDIGGQWLYDPNVEQEDPMGLPRRDDGFLKVHSSIYASLRLTSPREIMGFTDFPFVGKKGRDLRRFPGHKELLLYLQDFCGRFGLRDLIRFKTRIESVEMLDYPASDKGLKWMVKSKAEKPVEEIYDAVVVATGQYSHPRLPKIKGTII
ncbi:hypothetical protein OROMI_003353 [Orobanche minor]